MDQAPPSTSTDSLVRTRRFSCSIRSIGLCAALVTGAMGVVGCDRPLVVTEGAVGSELLPLTGEKRVTGTTTKTLRFGSVELAKGTKVRVGETWLVRKNPGDPPSYRIKGFYDLSVRSDGFVLPARSVNVFFNALVGPAYEKTVPIPREAFQRD